MFSAISLRFRMWWDYCQRGGAFLLPRDLRIERNARLSLNKLVQATSDTQALILRLCPNYQHPRQHVQRVVDRVSQLPKKEADVGNWLQSTERMVNVGYMYLSFALSAVQKALKLEDNDGEQHRHLCFQQRFESLYAQLSALGPDVKFLGTNEEC